MSPCPYFDAFEEEIDLRKFDITKHRTAGLDGCLILGGMAPSTPGAKITHWRTRLKAAMGWHGRFHRLMLQRPAQWIA
jgi:hypothetical protein